jgi:saccharopine dehydrogenase-like NADP-dependent oxidoreductase
MKKILVLGAGLSASSLIRYLLQHSEENNWEIRVVDQSLDLVKRKLDNHRNGVALSFDALNPVERFPQIQEVDLVISMLPAKFHIDVARDCLKAGKHLITPSYVSPDMKELNDEVKKAGLIFMNEIGVDPGIDHMSAMKIIDEIKENGGELLGFKSYCGGLIAPVSDNNPWHYKFTWNPRNVVLAGHGTAQYIDRGQYKFIPYGQIFQRIEQITVDAIGTFEGYANRDSLSYREVYGLEDIPTMYRGTLRGENYCAAWNIFVQLGLTDDSYQLPNSESLTARTFLNTFLPYDETKSVEEKFTAFCKKNGVDSIELFEYLDLFNGTEILGKANASPAQLLELILVDKWKLEPDDKDMLVMVHKFEYQKNGKRYEVQSSMINVGEDQVYTSMSNTVGLPVAICAKHMLNGNFTTTGVQVPTAKDVYTPILDELSNLGILFNETEREI